MRTLSASAQEAVIRKAIVAVQRGTSPTEVAELFGVSRQAVHNWLRAYRKGGEKALNAKKRGHVGHIQLKPWQAALTVRIITDRLPDQLKLPYALWSREAVAQYIERQFGLHLSLNTVGRYLKHWGFTPQKPARCALEKDQAAVDLWLQEAYPAIRRQAAVERATIYWGDEMGVRSTDQTGRSYARKGHTPVIPSPGKRFGCNMISAINNRGHMKFMVFKENFTSEVFIEYLVRLIESSSRKVYLIMDNHRVHHSKQVTDWLKEQAEDISIFFLPAYSPELNPDEFLNNDVKSNGVGRKRAKDADELLSNLLSHMDMREAQPKIIKKFFHAPSVRYAGLRSAKHTA